MSLDIKYCRKCGFKLYSKSAFCSKCGTKIILSEPASVTKMPEKATSSNSTRNNNVANTVQSPAPIKKTGSSAKAISPVKSNDITRKLNSQEYSSYEEFLKKYKR